MAVEEAASVLAADTPAEQGSPIDFDAKGELVFRVGASKQVFRVCPFTASRASPAFDKMLNGRWAESKSNLASGQDWTIELPEDDEVALAVVFHIIHSQHHMVKTTLSVAELFNVCVIVHKYDCVGMTYMWARGWCDGIPSDALYSDDRLLWIAWVLGHEVMFRNAATVMFQAATVVRCSRLEEAQLVTQRSHIEEEFEYIDSIGILDSMKSAREKIIGDLLRPLAKFSTLLHGDDPTSSPCTVYAPDNENSQHCQCYVLGSFIRGLKKHSLFPVPRPNSITMSISQLSTALREVDFQQWTKFDYSKHHNYTHERCGLNQRIRPEINAVSLAFSPDSKFLTQVNSQARKTGLLPPL